MEEDARLDAIVGAHVAVEALVEPRGERLFGRPASGSASACVSTSEICIFDFHTGKNQFGIIKSALGWLRPHPRPRVSI